MIMDLGKPLRHEDCLPAWSRVPYHRQNRALPPATAGPPTRQSGVRFLAEPLRAPPRSFIAHRSSQRRLSLRRLVYIRWRTYRWHGNEFIVPCQGVKFVTAIATLRRKNISAVRAICQELTIVLMHHVSLTLLNPLFGLSKRIQQPGGYHPGGTCCTARCGTIRRPVPLGHLPDARRADLARCGDDRPPSSAARCGRSWLTHEAGRFTPIAGPRDPKCAVVYRV
jgi:hypothetical protein